ncbi:hypothetical protein BGZ94_007619 [Podila epigama]|nr:hypothetical protein BGZ94_007619 [Podila epigama]
MATFAACHDLHRHPSTRHAGLAAISFSAKDNVEDELQGVPPATSFIFGQCQFLKSLSHPNLCEYLDIVKGKRDRLFVVSEHHNNSLQLIRNKQDKEDAATHKGQDLKTLRAWGAQILDALAYLNTHGVVHRTLTLANILLNSVGDVKLSNYGLFNMTKGGTLVQFSIGEPHYLSPNALGQTAASAQDYSVDIWSVGVILTEMYLGESFWSKERQDLDELIASLFTIRRLSITTKDWIHACDDSVGINSKVLAFLKTPPQSDAQGTTDGQTNEIQEFVAFIRECLSLEEFNSRDASQLRDHIFFKAYDDALSSGTLPSNTLWHQKPLLQSSLLPDFEGETERLRKEFASSSLDGEKQAAENESILSRMPLSQVFYLWKLAGGDVEAQFKKLGRLVGTPVIQLLPRFIRVKDNKEERPSVRDIADLFSDEACVLSIENLEAEILKSIHEPNKGQFSWDTDYFLFSDPDEMNFLVGAPGESHQEAADSKAFLYPDSMQMAPGSLKPLSASFLSPSNDSAGGMVGISPSLAQQPTKMRAKVPLSIREKDLGYQYQRLTMFTDLLLQYPASRAEILHHSKIDIPPLLRGKVWAAILGVVGDYDQVYADFDKYTEKPTDHQIELDVPRCHQYNQLMFSQAGHEKLKRLLKCWVEANEHQVYWQGLDSCCAPFLTLSFNDEALAFACIQRFLPKFLKDMFLHDNSQVIHEYLAVFRHMLSFHDPELSSHLAHIGFIPQLYAISWFMTLFTHIFPLDKIYHLWDKILVGPSSLPLFVGIAILQQFRQELMRSEFNEAISIFSESFPEMDIEKCIEAALSMCRVTPPSTCWLSYDSESREARRHSLLHGSATSNSGAVAAATTTTAAAGVTTTENDGVGQQESQESRQSREKDLEKLEKRLSGGVGMGTHGNFDHWWEEPLSVEILNAELAPRIHRSDLIRLRQQALVIDIRPAAEFRNGHYPLSIQMNPNQLDHLLQILKKLKRKYVVVLADRGTSGPEFASLLVQDGFARVSLLMGGIDALRVVEHPVSGLGSTSSSSLSSSPSISSAVTSSTLAASYASPICSCRVIRQVISVPVKTKEEVVVHKCKTPFANTKPRASSSVLSSRVGKDTTLASKAP